MSSQLSELGAILYQYERCCVCEKGIFIKKTEGTLKTLFQILAGNSLESCSILYNDIERIYQKVTQRYLNGIPQGGIMQIIIDDRQHGNNTTVLNLRASFEIREKHWSIYNTILHHIVSNVFERQWLSLVDDLSHGRNVSFDKFRFTPKEIIFDRPFGKFGSLDLNRLVGSVVNEGRLYVLYKLYNSFTAKNEVSDLYLGKIENIPNLHLATAFLQNVAKRNLSASPSS